MVTSKLKMKMERPQQPRELHEWDRNREHIVLLVRKNLVKEWTAQKNAEIFLAFWYFIVRQNAYKQSKTKVKKRRDQQTAT